MSRTIDERVVEMRFDNRNFERGIDQTINSLDKLHRSLDMKGATKGLESVDKAANDINIDRLGNAVESVKVKFSAFGVVAVSALSNITNSVIGVGKQIIKSLTIEPMKQGFSEYELKMGSIQTIMMSTGESLDTVNRYLEELNTYADKTIYSFSDMTSNIGKFTNAGVSLKDAVKAIQGVSNVAAVSGANAEQASRAMWNFAQALSSGSVKLLDWKSIANAQMDGVEFKNQLLETAVACGTLEKAADGMYRVISKNAQGSKFEELINAEKYFNESLSYQWLTTETLIKTLGNYADETTDIGKKAFKAAMDIKTFNQMVDTVKESVGSGWAITWEHIFGNFEEAKQLWTEVYAIIEDVLSKFSDARNNLLKGWKELGGRNDLIESFKNIYEALKSIITPIAEAFREIFPPKTAEELYSFTKGLKNFTKQLALTVKSSKRLKTAFKGIFSAAKVIWTIAKNVLSIFKPLFVVLEIGGYIALALASAIGKIGEVVSNFILSSKLFTNAGKIINDIFFTMVAVVKEVQSGFDKKLRPSIDKIKKAFEDFIKIVDDVKAKFGEIIETAANTFGVSLEPVRSIIEEVKASLSKGFNVAAVTVLKTTFDIIGNGFRKIVDGLKQSQPQIIEFLDKVKNALSIETVRANIQKIKDGFKTAFDSISKNVSYVFDKIKTRFNDFFNKFDMGSFLATIDATIRSIKTMLNGSKNAVLGFFRLLKPSNSPLISFSVFLKTIFNDLGDASETIQKAFSDAFESIKNKNTFDELKIKMANFFDSIKTGFSNAMSHLKKFGSSVVEAFKNFDSEKLRKWITAISTTGIAVALKNLTKLLSESLKNVGSVKNKIVDVLDSVRGCFEAYQNSIKSKIIKEIAKAILLLGVSLILIASIDADKLNGALIAISALFGELMVAMGIFSLFTKKLENQANMVMLILSFSAAIVILAEALKIISTIKTEKLLVSGLAIRSLMGALLVAAFVMQYIKPSSLNLNMLVLSASLLILASAVEKISNVPVGDLGRSTAAIIALTIALGAANRLAGSGSAVRPFGFLIMAASMVVLAKAINMISKSVDPEMLKFVISELNRLVLCMGVAAAIMPRNMMSVGTGMVLFAASLLVMTKAMEKVVSMIKTDSASFEKGMKAMKVAIGGITIALRTLSKDSALKGAAAMLIASLAIRQLASTLYVINLLTWEDIVKCLKAIGGAFLVLGIAGAVLRPVIPAILALGAALALIGTGFALTGRGLITMALGIGSLVAVFSLSSKALKTVLENMETTMLFFLESIINFWPKIAEIVLKAVQTLCQVIIDSAPLIAETIKTVILTTIEMLVDVVPTVADGLLELLVAVCESLVKRTEKIVELIMEFVIAVINGFANKLPELIDSVVNLLTSLFSGVIQALKKIDPSIILESFMGIGLIMALMTALNMMVLLAPGAMLGVLLTGAVIAELALVLAAIGALSKIPGITDFVADGGNFLQVIGSAIGKFFGGIVGGFANGVASQLPEIGTYLSEFMKNAEGFITGANSIKTGAMSNVKELVEAFLDLTGANFVSKLTSWLNNKDSISQFSEQLMPFGEMMVEFSNTVEGINSENITAAAEAATALSDLASSIPRTGGFLQDLIGEKDMGNFSVQLVAFGGAIVLFADTVENLKTDVVEKAAAAGGVMAELANDIPTTGGLLQLIMGEKDMGKFGLQLVAFGGAIVLFADTVENLEASVVENAAKAAGVMIELANNIPYQGGVLGLIFGNYDLSVFGTQLVAFGSAIKSFSAEIENINPDLITKTATACTALATLSNDIPTTGGIVSWFTGDASLETFGKNLEKFGKSMAKYSDSLQNVDFEIIYASTWAFEELASFVNSLTGTDSGSLVTFSQNMATLGSDSAGKFITTFTETITAGSESILNSVTSMSNRTCKAMTTTLELCVTEIKRYRRSFHSAGSYLVDGFANGISANTYKATAKARAMARAAAEAAEAELDIQSPSKVGYEIGAYFGEGFANGISSYESIAYTASSDMANSAKEGLRNTIKNIGSMVDSAIDSNPTIRPLLDLSNVRKGSNALSSMISRSQAISISSGFVGNNSSAICDAIIQNRNTNDDVVSAIGSLHRDFQDLGELIMGTQVTLDGNAVVGHLINKIDSKLGIMAMHKGRGN